MFHDYLDIQGWNLRNLLRISTREVGVTNKQSFGAKYAAFLPYHETVWQRFGIGTFLGNQNSEKVRNYLFEIG